MARKSKLELLLSLDDKLFNNKLTKVQGKLKKGTNRMRGSLDKLQMKFGELTNEIPILGRALNLIKNPWVGMAVGGAAFIALSKRATDAVSDFNHAFLPIRQLNLDKPKAELDSYRREIRDAAFDVGINLGKATNAFYDLQSATGEYGDDAIEIFKQVGRYSLATGADVNDAMNATTKAMKAYGLETKDVEKLLASNAKTVQVGITTFDELAKSQTTYSGAAATAGQTIDNANKVFAAFTSISKNTEQAANQTKTFFEGLQQQGDKIEESLNIKLFDDGEMRAADHILQDISDRFKTMSDEEISKVITQIGGTEGLRAALGKAAKGADDLISTFEKFDSSQFSMADAVANAEGDYKTMKKVFFDRIEILMTKFGEKILPMVAGFFDKLTPVLNWLYKNIDWLLPVVGSFVGVLGLATAAMWAFNAAAAANPIGLIVAAVAGLIALVVTIIKKWDEWGAAVTMFMGPVGTIISMFKSLYDHWDSIKEAFADGGIIAGLKRIGVVLLDALLKPIQQLLGWISKIPGMSNLATKGIDKISELRQNLDLETEGEKKLKQKTSPEKETQVKESNAYGLDDVKDDPEDDKSTLDVNKDISSTVGKGNQVKNVTINIESMISGGITMAQDAPESMTREDLENLLSELLMRVTTNANAM